MKNDTIKNDNIQKEKAEMAKRFKTSIYLFELFFELEDLNYDMQINISGWRIKSEQLSISSWGWKWSWNNLYNFGWRIRKKTPSRMMMKLKQMIW